MPFRVNVYSHGGGSLLRLPSSNNPLSVGMLGAELIDLGLGVGECIGRDWHV